MTDKNLYAVVMAGGKGERFWPQSRANRPKQLLRLLGNLTLIEQTVDRLRDLLPLSNCLVITNEEYVPAMRSLLHGLPPENIIGEPVGRDTGPCVALAAGVVRERSRNADNAAMIVLPADHSIHDLKSLHQVLRDSVEVTRRESCPVVIGVQPTFPATGYGYIQCAEKAETETKTSFLTGKKFWEKPGMNTAQKFINDGNYLWNSGMFIWALPVIDAALQKHAPELWKLSEQIGKAEGQGRLTEVLAECFERCSKISIDYAVMEYVEKMLVAECSFDWDDVGSWTALRNQIRPRNGNNVVRGLFSGIDATDCIIVGESDHLIAAIDVQDLIIVETEDVTLVCHARSAQRVKEMVQELSKDPRLKKFV